MARVNNIYYNFLSKKIALFTNHYPPTKQRLVNQNTNIYSTKKKKKNKQTHGPLAVAPAMDSKAVKI